MLRANQAVRLGLRAAMRNPELAFGKALLDQLGNLLGALPVLLAAALVFGRAESLPALVRALQAVRWPLAGGALAAASIAFLAGAFFWAGALPLLAADAELDRRPPPGNFALLASRGLSRVVLATLLADGLSLLFSAIFTAAVLLAPLAMLWKPSALLLAGLAALVAAGMIGGVLIDLLGRLVLIRAAVFGEGASAAFGKAASLLAERLSGCLIVTVAFFFLELIAAAVMGALTGFLSSGSLFDADTALLSIAPRLAAGLAFAAVFAWLEVGRQGALAAIAADAEGLIEAPPEPPPVPRTLERSEQIIEALPVPDDDPKT